jgi:hypothetical protein
VVSRLVVVAFHHAGEPRLGEGRGQDVLADPVPLEFDAEGVDGEEGRLDLAAHAVLELEVVHALPAEKLVDGPVGLSAREPLMGLHGEGLEDELLPVGGRFRPDEGPGAHRLLQGLEPRADVLAGRNREFRTRFDLPEVAASQEPEAGAVERAVGAHGDLVGAVVVQALHGGEDLASGRLTPAVLLLEEPEDPGHLA